MKHFFSIISAHIATHKSEVVLFSLALISRLVSFFFLVFRYGEATLWFSNEDALGYLNMAHNLSQGNGFMMDGIQTAIRTPLYPLFLSLFDVLHLPLLGIAIVQIVLFSVTVVVLYRLGLLLFNERVAIFGALLLVFEPYLITLPNLATTETVFILLSVLATYYLARAIFQDTRVNFSIALSGILWGLAVLTRPIALYMLPVVLITFFCGRLFLKQDQPKRIFIGAGLCAFLFIAILFPWSLRQKIVFDSWKISNIDTFMLITRVAPIAVAERDSISYYDALPVVMNKDLPNLISDFDPSLLEHTFAYEKPVQAYLSELYRDHWPAIAKTYVYSLTSTLFGTGYDYLLEEYGLSRHEERLGFTQLLLGRQYGLFIKKLLEPSLFQAVILFGALVWFVFYVLIARALWLSRKTKDIAKLLFLLIIAGYFIFFSLGPSSHARYRVPAYPFLLLLAGYAIESVYRYARDRNIDSG